MYISEVIEDSYTFLMYPRQAQPQYMPGNTVAILTCPDFPSQIGYPPKPILKPYDAFCGVPLCGVLRRSSFFGLPLPCCGPFLAGLGDSGGLSACTLGRLDGADGFADSGGLSACTLERLFGVFAAGCSLLACALDALPGGVPCTDSFRGVLFPFRWPAAAVRARALSMMRRASLSRSSARRRSSSLGLSTTKCATMGFLPLVGSTSCGQADMTMTTSRSRPQLDVVAALALGRGELELAALVGARNRDVHEEV